MRPCAAEIDLGGTKIQAVVTGPGGEVVGQARFNTPRRGGPDAVADGIAHAIGEAATAAGARVRELAGVGVGAPGSIDPGAGVVVKVPNLDGWDEPFRAQAVLTKRLGVGRRGERRQRRGRRRAALRLVETSALLGVFWGTGVGGGLVLDGRLVHGRGSAGELGHMCVKAGGRRCNCGLRGCAEAYAGRGALEEERAP